MLIHSLSITFVTEMFEQVRQNHTKVCYVYFWQIIWEHGVKINCVLENYLGTRYVKFR